MNINICTLLYVCMNNNIVPSPWYGFVWNVHRMSIKIEHRNLETRKTLDDFFVQVRNFLLPLSLKVLRHKEREAQSFLFWLLPPPTRVSPATKVSASKRKSTVSSRGRSQPTPLTFFKFPRSSAHFRCMTSFALASPRFLSQAIVTSLSYTYALRVHAREHLC